MSDCCWLDNKMRDTWATLLAHSQAQGEPGLMQIRDDICIREIDRRSEVHGQSGLSFQRTTTNLKLSTYLRILTVEVTYETTLWRTNDERKRKERGMKGRRERAAARDLRPECCKMSDRNLWHWRCLSSPHLTDPLACRWWSPLYI